MRMIIIGAPGSGKGTQAEYMSKRFSIPTISTGMIIRSAIREGTRFGLMAKGFIDKGELVPDDVMIKMIGERLAQDDCKNGFILDGYPRTVAQAEELDNSNIHIDKVLIIQVEDEEIIGRLSGRLECKACGSSYHVKYRISKAEGTCDMCGGPLVTRDDDKPEVIKHRLDTYHEQTEPLKGYYQNQGKLCVAYGQEEIKDTTAEVLKALGEEE